LYQRRRSTGVSQLLFVGMLAVLVGQASAEDILPQLALDSTHGSSEQRFTEEEIERNQLGNYGYLVTKTVVPTLYILSLAMVGAGAVAALIFIGWVVKTLFRLSKIGYKNSILLEKTD